MLAGSIKWLYADVTEFDRDKSLPGIKNKYSMIK